MEEEKLLLWGKGRGEKCLFFVPERLPSVKKKTVFLIGWGKIYFVAVVASLKKTIFERQKNEILFKNLLVFLYAASSLSPLQ